MQPAMRWVLTSRDGGGWLAEQPADALLPGAAGADGLPVVFVDAGHRFQPVLGFGGAFTEAAALTWQRLDGLAREELLRAYFDPVHGHGYTLCRVHMGSCDFALGNYAHAAQDGDFALDGFDIARDRQALLPFIRAAQAVAGAPLQLLASPWSPPAWMKTNGQMNGGGRLRPECRDAWAACYARFIDAYAREGVPIWGVSVQNEPMAAQRWDSCLWSAEEERDFVRDHLAPALDRAGLGQVQIVVWDHNRDAMVERASVIYADPRVRERVWGCGFHWYVEDHFDHVRLVHDAWPDKHLLFTEGCQEGGPHPGAWEVGERYARSMIHDLNGWTEGWIDWNLLLDEQGGPNHVGNFCSAPMLADTAAGRLLPQSAYAYIGHFARFVRRGARRVLCAATREVLECTAFVDDDGRVATIVMNRSEAPQSFVLRRAGAADDRIATLPPRAIATFVG
jgi:glucosylceramidase